MSIKKNFFAPLALGLGATRRAAVLLLVMMLTATTAWAQGPGQVASGSCGDNLTWELMGNTLTISGSGAMYDYEFNSNPAPWSSYAEQIYEVVIENGVTSIGVDAFSECGALESVTFAEGSKLESIGESAFVYTGLTSIEIPASVTSIGNYAFYSTNLTSIEIPASVTSIGMRAFSSCNDLESVTFAEGSKLESIGESAFQLCYNLTSITIPASVTSIGSYVFQNCDLASMAVADGNTVYDSRNGCNAIIEKSTNKLIIGCKNSTIPASVTSIGNYAFYATNLTSIEIPASVTSIGMRAFQNCSSLATVTVYAPSCSLGVKAFAYCNNLANIYVFSDKVDTYKGAENWSSYEDKITEMPNPNGKCGDNVRWALTGESTNYTLTITGSGAMANYTSSSVQPWNDYRSSIKTVVIGNGVTSIGNYTFAKCTGLTSIEIPASVTSIGDDAFWDCSNLATVTFAEDSQLATIGISAFNSCRGLASVEIPAGVTSIGYHAFHTCTGLATVSFAAGSQLTSIGNYAFNNTGLTSIEIPASVTSIGEGAFSGIGLTSIEIPASVTSIGEGAFYGTGLTSIEIPASVTSIGVGAFANCSNLEAITVDGGNTVYDSRNGCNAIIVKSTNTLIAGCKNSTIPASVTSIGDKAFAGSGLTSIEIPASVTSIGGSAFTNTGLTSIDIPAGVTSIGSYVFSACNGLGSVTFAEGSQLTSIGSYAFNRCSGLTSVTIPASVTSIGSYAFANTGLTSIEIPASVTSIGNYAFQNCPNLATVTVYAPSCTLGDKAFADCDKLTKIYVFGDKVASYKAATNWKNYAGKITALPTVTTSYVDATGTLHEGVEAVPLNNAMTTLSAGWYVVNDNVDYKGMITLGGDVNIILADGKKMTVTNTGTGYHDYAIYGEGKALHIYGQSQGTGALTATAEGLNAIIIGYDEIAGRDGFLGIHGGVVTASTSNDTGIGVYSTTADGGIVINGGRLMASGSSNGFGIYCEGGHFDILGGQVTANGGLGFCSFVEYDDDWNLIGLIPCVLTLGCSKPTDFISTNKIDNYEGEDYEGEVKIAAGQTLVDAGGNIYNSATASDDLAALKNVTLRPVMGVTLTKDGGNISAAFDGTSTTTLSIPVDITVNSVTLNRTFTLHKCATLMLPFSLGDGQSLNGGTLYKFDGVNNGEGDWVATLSEFTSPLKANTPYLIKPNGHMTDDKITFDLNGGTVTLNTTTAGEDSNEKDDLWDFIGTYSYIKWTSDTGDQDYSAEREAEIGKVYGFAAVEKTGIRVGDFVRVASGAKIRPMCAYLKWKGSIPNNARALTRAATNDDTELPQRITVKLVSASGETTAIGTIDNGQLTIDNYADADGWYDLQGRKLSGKPTKKGLYINNGRKIVIK